MKKIIFQILVGLFPFMAWGQQPTMQEQGKSAIDSLQGLLIQTESDSLKAIYYLQLASQYRRTNNPLEAKSAAERALAIATQAGLERQQGFAHINIGRVLNEMGDYALSVKSLQQAIPIFRKSGEINIHAFTLQLLGKSYEQQQLYDVANSSYLEAYELVQSLPDSIPSKPNQLAFVLNNLGNIAFFQDSLQKGLEYQKACLAIREKQSNNLNIAYSYNDIAGIYSAMDSIMVAKDYYEKAWETFQAVGEKRVLSIVGNNIAGIYLRLEKPDQALPYAQTAIEQAYQVKDKQSIMAAAGVLAAAYAAKEQYKPAFEYQEVYVTYRDSITDEQQLREMGRLESQLELDAKESLNQKQQDIIEQQNTTNVIIGSSLVIVLFLAGLLFRLQQKQRKANDLLHLQNEEIIAQKEELSLQAERLQKANEAINQQKEEIYGQAVVLQKINSEIQEKNEVLVDQNLIIEKKNKDTMASITYASRIQSALLPFASRLNKAFESHFVFYLPRDVVSGDFYWYGEVNGKQVIAAVDCTGHGVPGAFMSMLGYSALDDVVLKQQIDQPDKILLQLDRQIQHVLQQEQTANKDGMDAAICVIDRERNTLAFAGAKNPLLILQGGESTVVKGDIHAIGGLNFKKGEKQFTQHEFSLDTPTTCYLYSDGYQDQFGGPNGRKFLAKRFRNLLIENAELPMNMQSQRLNEELRHWMGEEESQLDDILVIGFRP